jgi:UPF0716 protein FxsA
MGRLALILLIILPIAEIAVFVKLGQTVGILPTLLGVLLLSALGVWLIRLQGLALGAQLRVTLGRGQLPGRAMADAMFVFVAGFLLAVPGYITDILALLLLIGPLRDALYRLLSRHLRPEPVRPAEGEPYRPRPGPQASIDLDPDAFRQR